MTRKQAADKRRFEKAMARAKRAWAELYEAESVFNNAKKQALASGVLGEVERDGATYDDRTTEFQDLGC